MPKTRSSGLTFVDLAFIAMIVFAIAVIIYSIFFPGNCSPNCLEKVTIEITEDPWQTNYRDNSVSMTGMVLETEGKGTLKVGNEYAFTTGMHPGSALRKGNVVEFKCRFERTLFCNPTQDPIRRKK